MNVLSQRGNPELGTGFSGVAVEHLWRGAAQHQPAVHPPECTLNNCSLKLASFPPLRKINKARVVLPASAAPLPQLYPSAKGNPR